MKRAAVRAFLLLVAATAIVPSQQFKGRPPSFSQFKVPEYRKKAAPVKILTAEDGQFRTRIREGATKGPNFAGHFTVVSWGCGSGCLSFVVVDAASGKVNWSSPFQVLGMPYKG